MPVSACPNGLFVQVQLESHACDPIFRTLDFGMQTLLV